MRPKLSRYKYIRRFDNEHPTLVLANTDDGPSKDFLLANGWAGHEVPQEQLYDLLFDPNEAHNLVENLNTPRRSGGDARAAQKVDVRDRILDPRRPRPLPQGAELNTRDQLSADDPTATVA